MALAATLLPSGRVRSVMASTTLGLAMAGSFTSSDTWGGRGGEQMNRRTGMSKSNVLKAAPKRLSWVTDVLRS